MTQALEHEMYNYFNQLNEAEKRSVIQLLKTFLHRRIESNEPVSIEEYSKEIAEAEAEFEREEFITNEEVLKQIKQW
jgi:hypothetical protein